MSAYIDVHCHLTGGEYGDVGALVRSLEGAGIGKVISAGFDIPSSEGGAELAEKYTMVYFTAGFHPTELKKYRDGDLYRIEELLKHPKCVALGEIGLDYHYEDTDRPLQHALFHEQLQIAHAAGMPVQIHSRDCAEDMLAFLRGHADLITCGALLHCYSHSAEMSAEFAKLGVSFSFGGTSTWKGGKRAKKSIASIAPPRLLTETDSPYLPPASKYGTFPNTPASIPEITANMALLKGMDEGTLRDIVWSNAHALFKKLNN